MRQSTVKPLRDYLRRMTDGPMVRPLALAGPILVIVIALPLLRPLRHPGDVSTDEMLRLATIRSLVERQSLALDRGFSPIPGVVQTPTGTYSAQPPMMALLLSVPAWLLTRFGYSFVDNHVLIAYLLTLLGVTLPVAATAGVIYRMGRLFELRRTWRSAMGFCVVAGSGLLSYAVVLNPQAPAAALLVASAACLIHVAAMNRDDRRAGWFALAGGCAALAATLEPAASVLLLLFLCVIPAMRFSLPRRMVGILLYILGAIPVISLHAAWNYPVTGDIMPASLHLVLRSGTAVTPAPAPAAPVDDLGDDDASTRPRTFWEALGAHVAWLFSAGFGEHGLFSHFPVMVLGILGIGAVMHRHWPSSTKTLAAATGIGALAIIFLYRLAHVDWSGPGAMFATKGFILFSPMLLFWGGAWVRRRHSPTAWSLAGIMLLFSMAIGILGATGPMPRRGFDRYSAIGALQHLMEADSSTPSVPLAGKAP